MWLLLMATPAPAQSVLLEGRVIDDGTGEPIPGAQVILERRNEYIGRMAADEEGRFAFHVTTPGWYRLRASRIGYQRIRTPPLEIGEYLEMEVEIRLSVDAVLLAPLEITARSHRSESVVLADFYHRMDRGSGHYITRDQIERRRPANVTDVLATVPGVRITGGGGRASGGRHIQMGRALPGVGGGECPTQIFVDGNLVTRRGILSETATGGAAVPVPIDDIVRPADIEGIEVYRGLSSVPAEFMNENARCGVIGIWTRRGS